MANEVVEAKGAENKRVMVGDFQKGIFATSDNFLLATQMAKALASSTLVPQEFQGNWSNCLIALEQANRLGMSAFLVIQNMYIVYGRPSWSSKFLIAMINGSGKYDQPLMFREEQKDGKPFACTAWTTLNGKVIEGMRIDMDIARAEKWVDKNGSKWKTMPQLMLRYRAASFFASLNCPEITMGLYTQEEAEEMSESGLDATFAEVSEAITQQSVSEVIDIGEQAALPDKEPVKNNAKAGKAKAKEPATDAAEPIREAQDGQMQLDPGF